MLRRDYRILGITDRLAARHLWSGVGVTVVATEWRRDRHPERAEGMTPYAAVEVMRRGSFLKHSGRTRTFADCGAAVFFRPGESFAVSHPVGDANSGATIRISEERFAAVADTEARSRRSSDTGFARPSAPLPSADYFALVRLVAALESEGPRDELEFEEAVLDLASRMCALASSGTGAERAGEGAPSASDEARARRAREFLTENYAEPLRLAAIGAAIGCSEWHASKTFRRVTGSTLHSWLSRVRLRHALDALAAGALDLTRLALAVGFSSHSHFTSAFRAEFGMTPRTAREALDAARDGRLPRFRPDGVKP